jgi:hypothetical protein
VLLLGRTEIVLDDVRPHLDMHNAELHAGTTFDDMVAILDAQPIDIVIMGAGIDIETRLAIVKHIFAVSTSTTVHMKDWDSGPQGMLPFVNGILDGLA